MGKLVGMAAVRDKVSLAELARKLGVTRGAVWQWEEVPANRVKDVSDATGIAPEVLRPDLASLFSTPSETRESA